MNCSQSEFVMPLYLSSELDATPMAEFELHVQRCASCARELEYARQYDELLRDACLEEPANILGLRERVLREISHSRPRRGFLFRRAYWMPVAAALVLAMAVGTYLSVRDRSSGTVYADVLEDHYNEVVNHITEGWRETPQEIRAFAREELGNADFLDKLAPADYHLARARHCDLPDHHAYVHLVYESDVREISIYVRRSDNELPGATVETVNGCGLHAAAINKFEIAGFQSQRYTILVVSDLPRAESLRIARNAALGLT
jgi:hypothetical protein